MQITRFPEIVEQAIQQELSTIDHQALVASAERLSENFRAIREQNKSFSYSQKDIFGYLALRTPATYAQIFGVLTEVKKQLPDFKPHSLLDIGSGPGTAMWAVSEVFPSLRQVTMLEKQKEFIQISKHIAAQYPKLNIDWQQVNFGEKLPRLEYMYDIVIISNVLNEVGEFERNKMLTFAREYCSGVVLVIEPGTSSGNALILQTTHNLIQQGGNLIAPFVGNSPIFDEKEWIHFHQKIYRPEFQRRIRKALREDNLTASDIEESKYSYVAWYKNHLIKRPWGRLIQKPKLVKGYVELIILTAEKVEKIKILKRNREFYKTACHMYWGDVIENKEILGLG